MASSPRRKSKRKRLGDNDSGYQLLGNAMKKLKLIDLGEYKCCICSRLPLDKVFQCPTGCIICPACYPKLDPCRCPQCRVPMNKNNPIRCRMAESLVLYRSFVCDDIMLDTLYQSETLSLRLVTCRNDQCGKSMEFEKLKVQSK